MGHQVESLVGRHEHDVKMVGETHENFAREHIPVGSDRGFGVVFAVVFGVVGTVATFRESGLNFAWFAASSGTLGLALFSPKRLHPFNLVWHKFGLLLGRITNPIVLGILFFLVLTPTRIVVKMFGKDPLRRKLDPDAKTYWISRNPPGPDPQSMNRQF